MSRRRRRDRNIALSLLILLSFQFIIENFIFAIPRARAASPPQTFQLTFGPSNDVIYYSTSDHISTSQNILTGATDWNLTINGSALGKVGTYDTATGVLTLSSVFGTYSKMIGKEFTNPGHHIQRDLIGKRWQHQGEDTPNLQYISKPNTRDASDISQRPGEIVDEAYDLTNNTPTTHTSARNGSDLRSPEGFAVTHAYAAEPPGVFYPDGTDLTSPGTAKAAAPWALIASTVTIIKAVSNGTSAAAVVSAGPSSKVAGKGDVQLKIDLDQSLVPGDCSAPGGGDYIPTTYSGLAEDRNYCMSADTIWEGYTYMYQGSVTVTYGPPPNPLYPDLKPDTLTTAGPLTAGTASKFDFSFSVNYKDVPNTTSFRIQIIDVASKIVLADRQYSGIKQGQPISDSFLYTYDTQGTKQMLFTVNSNNGVDEGPDNKGNNQLTATFNVAGQGMPTGDFTIISSPMNYGDPVTFHPVNITAGAGCTYEYHYYKIDSLPPTIRAASTTQDTMLTTSTYPSGFGTGTWTVTLAVKTSCVATPVDVGSHSLMVNGKSGINHPPEFIPSWWYHGSNPATRVRDSVVCCSNKVDLKLVFDSTIPTPRDPDGDPFTFQSWDFNSSNDPWLQSLPSKYGFKTTDWDIFNIAADTPGYHTVYATMVDKWGAAATFSTSIDVVPPNPVPVISGPDKVKEGRTVSPAYTSNLSYSPGGTALDHSKDVWVNKQSVYNTPGSVTISLDVFDVNNLKSLSPATKTITVVPDDPPIAQAIVPSLGIRNQTYAIINKSYSPDKDNIVSIQYRVKYDSNNNGFVDDGWQVISGDMGQASYTPIKVGKYLFEVRVCEDYGKCGDTSGLNPATMTLDVVNNAPEVSFAIDGQNKHPDQSLTSIYSPGTIFWWNLLQTNSYASVPNRNAGWTISGSNLVASSGKDYGQQTQSYRESSTTGGYVNNDFKRQNSDNGYGYSMLSPWRAKAGNIQSFRLKDPSRNHGEDLQIHTAPDFAANDRYVYFINNNRIWALDKTVRSSASSPYAWQFSNVPAATFSFIYNDESYDPTDYYPVTVSNAGSNGVSKYFIADRTLYAQENWTIQTGNDSDGYATYTTYTKLVSRDAYTGQILAMIDPPGTASMTINDYLLVSNNGVYYWLDRNLNTARTKDLKTILANNYGCDGLAGLTRGQNNDFYAYATGCGGAAGSVALNVLRLDSDYNVIWKTPIRGRGFWSAYTYGAAFNGDDKKWIVELIPISSGNILWARSYDNRQVGGSPQDFYYLDMLDTNTGAVIGYNDSQFYNNVVGGSFNWNGTFTGGNNGVTLADGNSYSSMGYGQGNYFYDYLGDGYSIGAYYGYQNIYDSYGSPVCSNCGGTFFTISTGDPTTGPLVHNPYQLGQFISPGTQGDSEYGLTLNMAYDNGNSNRMGLSFRMADNLNRYAVETDGNRWSLSRYNGGNRTEMAGQNYTLAKNTDYTIKVLATGTHLQVWINGTPFFDLYDGSFGSGNFGPFTDKPFVTFNNLYTKQVTVGPTTWDSGVAIWEPSIGYAAGSYKNITYSDPENDPISGGYQWTYNHTPKFINNQGYSSMNGQTYNSNQTIFDKVGIYDITLKAKDDPNPGYLWPIMAFDNYRKLSNSYYARIVVHRRPIAQFTLTNSGGYITWNDSSYDPDRHDGGGWCSAPDATGIDYCGTRGILGRNYYYIDPNGTKVNAQLTRATMVGRYRVGLQVADEYGAESDWVEQVLDNGTPAPPNARPSAGIWYWSNDPNNPTRISGQNPVVTWGQSDPDGSYFSHVNLLVQDEGGATWAYLGNYYQNTYSGSNSWTISPSLPQGKKYKVRVQVRDGTDWSDWSPYAWIYFNTPPTATLTSPAGTDPSPTIIRTNRPAITWNQSDADPNTTFTHFEPIVRDQWQNPIGASSPGTMLGQWTTARSNSWAFDRDLPTNQKFNLSVRVSDGTDYSNWSNQGWVIVNRLPAASIIGLSTNKAAPTQITTKSPPFQWNQSDADGNNFKGYQVQVLTDAGTIIDDTGQVLFNNTNSTLSWTTSKTLTRSQEFQVIVRLYDGIEWGVWSPAGWFIVPAVNLPPAAILTYPTGTSVNPTLVYETKPTFNWDQSDPDPGTVFKKYQVQVFNAANAVVLDSGQQVYNTPGANWSWTASSDLPRGQKLWAQVSVWDEAGNQSPWSNKGWFIINSAPSAVLTWPAGTSANPDVTNSTTPTFTWTMSDPDAGTNFGHFELQVLDSSNTIILDSGIEPLNTTAGSANWTADRFLPNGQKLQARVRVDDGHEWSAWSNIGWFIVNTIPQAYLTWPTGTSGSPDVAYVNLRPPIRWKQIDAEPGTIFTYFQVQIHNSTGTLVQDSGQYFQGTTSNDQTWTPTSDLAFNTNYYAVVRTLDGLQWSNWSSPGWLVIKPNTPPTAVMVYPGGTQAAPTVDNNLRPTIQWQQTDPDAGTVFKAFQIQITNEANTVTILDSGQVSQNTLSTSGSWTVSRDLPTGQKLRVRVRTFDGIDWSNWSAQTWIMINRPPTGNISFTTPIYEHDTPTFKVTQSDPDGDAVSINVLASYNGGAFTTIQSWSGVPSGTSKAFTYGPLNQGTYVLRLTLTDPYGGAFTQDYSFTAMPLNITGYVKHTEDWENYQLTWNAAHPLQQRAANVFWAGESFMLSAVVTNTGVSATKPGSVKATLVETGDNIPLTSSDNVNFAAEILNTNFVHFLTDGSYTIRFMINWNNGLIQTVDVPVVISGNIYDVIVNQNRH